MVIRKVLLPMTMRNKTPNQSSRMKSIAYTGMPNLRRKGKSRKKRAPPESRSRNLKTR
jgi:hypothetical protein